MILNKTKQTKLVEDFVAYMRQNGGTASAWYVGVTGNINQRLFIDHKVRQNGPWIYNSDVISSQEAREVERYFINELGTDGGPSGGDSTVNRVYAYKKAFHTNP